MYMDRLFHAQPFKYFPEAVFRSSDTASVCRGSKPNFKIFPGFSHIAIAVIFIQRIADDSP